MAVHASHAALPCPVKGARWSVLIPYLSDDGTPTAPATPDTEISKDNAAAADCAEEASATSGMDGMALLTLSGAETDCSCLALNAKVASGPKATLLAVYPRVLPVLETGTAQAGANGSITLAVGAPAYDLAGCIVKTTGGTGGGGTGGANNQARVITAYNPSTKVATVVPNWETNPSSDTTYEILLTEVAVNAAVTRALRPTTDGRTLDVTATGEAGVDLDNTSGTLAKGTDLTGFNDLGAADVRTAVGLGSANLDTQLDALPTAGELATALGTADDAVLAAIAALNNLSQVQAQTAAAAALTAYDPPTNTELEARTPTVAQLAKMIKHLGGVLEGIAAAGGGTTTVPLNTGTGINGAAPSAVDNFYNGAMLVWITGAMAGQRTSVSDYNGTTKALTVVEMTGTPSVGDTFLLV